MRSFKIVETVIPVYEEKKGELLNRIDKEFGNVMTVKVRDGHVIVEGEGLTDHRIHDRMIRILTGE